MSQQSSNFKRYADYTSDQLVIPRSLEGHNYVHASNVDFHSSAEKIQRKILLIDSKSRNWDTEESNCYTVYLGEELRGVKSIELVGGYMPNSSYMITESNNLFAFQETHRQVMNGTYYSVIIPPGNYKIMDLLNELQHGMKVVGESRYQCELDEVTNRISIRTDDKVDTGIFNLIFNDGMEVVGDRSYIDNLVIDPVTGRKQIQKVETSNSRRRYLTNSIGRVLGFKALNLEGFNCYTGQMIYNLKPDEYLAIFVNTENAEDFGNVIAPSVENGAHNAFAIVPLNRDGQDFNLSCDSQQISDDFKYIRNFAPPISFSKIRIKFQTSSGKMYDFNGLDHYLLFEVFMLG